MNITSILPELKEVFLNELELLIGRHNEVAEVKRELIKSAVNLIKRVANSEKKLNLNNVMEISQLLENHRDEVVERLDMREIYYIHKYNSFHKGFNMSIGGDGCLGYKHTEQAKKK